MVNSCSYAYFMVSCWFFRSVGWASTTSCNWRSEDACLGPPVRSEGWDRSGRGVAVRSGWLVDPLVEDA